MRIVRFIDDEGSIAHGIDHQDGTTTILHGAIDSGFASTSARVIIKKPLAPLIPTDIICIGRNYRASSAGAASDERNHSVEQRSEEVVDPPRRDGGGSRLSHSDATLEVFLKPSTALQNPGDPILIPRFDGLDPQLDCEGELAVIIGREARNINEAQALSHVFGYTIANDVTARCFQTSGGGPPIWMRGKGFDTFCPLGPAIVTADEVTDPQSLNIRTLINDQVVREGNTRDMIRTVPQIIAALSRHMTLRAGAVILTGAPPALTDAPHEPVVQVTIEIQGIGGLHNAVANAGDFNFATGVQ